MKSSIVDHQATIAVVAILPFCGPKGIPMMMQASEQAS